MSKRSSKKSKRRSKAVPALGITGLSLSLASGAIASTGQAVDVPSTSQPPELFLGEEEIFDTSVSMFFTFDKENAGETSPAQMLKLAKGGCGGCGCGGHGGGGCGCGGHYGGGGCGCGHGGGYMGCAGGAKGMGMTCAGAKGMTPMGVKGMNCAGHGVHCRCAFFRRCFGCGCGGCGGWWGCGTCWIWTPTWGWVNTCWSESTTPTEVASVPSEPVAQTAEVAVKRK
jgi:hypothetical protein